MEDTTKKCPYCQTDISVKATICPNCRKKQKKPRNKKMLIVMFSLIGLLIVIGGLGGNNNSQEITSGSCSGKMKKVVSNEYKSPSTVNFISCNWDKSKGIYGEADAQNGFGAVIRTSFLCNGDSCLITEK